VHSAVELAAVAGGRSVGKPSPGAKRRIRIASDQYFFGHHLAGKSLATSVDLSLLGLSGLDCALNSPLVLANASTSLSPGCFSDPPSRLCGAVRCCVLVAGTLGSASAKLCLRRFGKLLGLGDSDRQGSAV